LHIHRIELTGKFTVSIQFPPSEELEVALPLLIVGPNGSGKSLLAHAIVASFASGAAQQHAKDILESAGIDSVKIQYIIHPWIADLAIPIPEGERRLIWTRVPAAHGHAPVRANGLDAVNELWGCAEPPQDDPGDLFPWLHVVTSGILTIPDALTLQERVLKAVKSPLERELAGWRARAVELAGDDGNGGRLAAARLELRSAEDAVARVDGLKLEIDALRNRREELASKIAEKRLHYSVLGAETEELTKACRLADRAVRIESWCDEIRRESREVQRLREQHAELLARLDTLEERFRGLPDDFPDRLQEFDGLCSRELMLNAETATAEKERQLIVAELEDVEREISLLPKPAVEEFNHRIQLLDEELESVNEEMTAMLRGRIELIRQREGLKQQMARDDSPFLALDVEQRRTLEAYLVEDNPMAPPVTRDTATETALLQTEEKLVVLRRKLREKFTGFDQLPDTARDLIHELAEARHHFSSYTSDLTGLRQRIRLLKQKANPGRAIRWSILSAIAAFTGVTALDRWDTGLFAALAASGLTMLLFRYIHRRADAELESTAAAEAMTQKRVETEREAVTRLERVLGSLAVAENISEALGRLAEYRALTEEHEQLQAKVVKYHKRLRAFEQDHPEPSGIDIGVLPQPVASLPLETLRSSYSGFCELEQQLKAVDSAWRAYEDGGEKAEELRSLEGRIADLRQSKTEIQDAYQRFAQKNEVRRSELNARKATLEALRSESSSLEALQAELELVRTRLASLQQGLGDLQTTGDVESLRREWNERETLRVRLREIRNGLSGHQTHDELRAREILLTEEAAEVKQKLTAIDPLYMLQGNASDCAAKYAGQLAATREGIAESETELRALQSEFEQIQLEAAESRLAGEPKLETLRSAVDMARERMEGIERDLMTTRDLMTSIESELQESDPATVSYLDEAVDHRLRQLSGERYLSLDMKDPVWMVACSDGGRRKMSVLSEGTQDLIWIAVRLALLDVAQPYDDNPIIWDEALARLDDSHLVRVREALCKIPAHRQVLLLTRHSSFETWGPVIQLANDAEQAREDILV
jgi:DNA repair exonuclease SbcCD ATPase subunit